MKISHKSDQIMYPATWVFFKVHVFPLMLSVDTKHSPLAFNKFKVTTRLNHIELFLFIIISEFWATHRGILSDVLVFLSIIRLFNDTDMFPFAQIWKSARLWCTKCSFMFKSDSLMLSLCYDDFSLCFLVSLWAYRPTVVLMN